MRRKDEETFSIEMDVLGTTNFFTKGTVSVLDRLLAEERSEEYDAIKDEPGSQTFWLSLLPLIISDLLLGYEISLNKSSS